MKHNPFSIFEKLTYNYRIPIVPRPPQEKREKEPAIDDAQLKHYIDLTAEKVAEKCKGTVAIAWKVLTIINIIVGLVISALTLINILKG